MKTLRTIIGNSPFLILNSQFLRWIFILVIALAPTKAAAQWSASGDTGYAHAVLQRARNARSFAMSLNAVENIPPGYAQTAALSAYNSLIDTRQRVTAQQRGLVEQTACLRTDLLLIEQEFERVHRQMLATKNMNALNLLGELLGFLSDRYQALLTGARDPAHRDPGWYGGRAFDGPRRALYDRRPLSADVCPFHSDYLPPSIAGYGCDAFALSAILRKLGTCDGSGAQCRSDADCGGGADACIGNPDLRDATKAETAALLTALLATVEYQKNVQALGIVSRQLDQFLADGTDPPLSLDRPHAQALVGCTAALPPGVVRHELRGPFSVESSPWILTLFREKRQTEERTRPLPTSFTVVKNILERVLGLQPTQSLVRFQSDQGGKESVTSAVIAEPAATFDRLATNVQEFAELSGKLTGVRSFVRDFAYFLRLSCVFRPCQARLDRVLKIVLTDACFPYANGAFLRDKPTTKPRWQLCKEAAGL